MLGHRLLPLLARLLVDNVCQERQRNVGRRARNVTAKTTRTLRFLYETLSQNELQLTEDVIFTYPGTSPLVEQIDAH